MLNLFCLNCNNQLSSDSSFCSNCGQKLKQKQLEIPIDTSNFLELARQGNTKWWTWTLGFIAILIGWQGIGFIPYLVACDALTLDCGTYKNKGFLQVVEYLFSNWAFVVGIIAIFLVARIVHKRRITQMITARVSIDYDRMLYAMGVGLLIFTLSTILSLLIGETLEFNKPEFNVYISFVLLAIILTPVQATMEEILFRGYILQGLALRTKNIMLLCLINGVLFMLPHLLNPEPYEYGFAQYAVNMIIIGGFFTLLTIKDNGIEIPMGYHAIINLFIGLFITTKTSVIHTPALFTASRFEETGLTGPWIIYEVILYALAYSIFSRKYKWNNDWIKDIRSRVSR